MLYFRINKLVKEKEELQEKFRNTTAEMKSQNQQLQEQAENLANEIKFLRKENKELHKEISKAGQDGPTMDMAKLLKRYYEIEEQFGQMKKDIKQEMKHALAKKEKKIVQQVQEHIVENEKKMQNHVEKQLGETNEYVQKQVEVRLMENEKYLQERLGVNEVKMWAHSQEIQQNMAKHDKQVQDRLGENEVKVQELGQKVQQNLAEHDKQVQDRLGANEVKVQELARVIEQNIAKHDQHVQESLLAKEAKIQQDVMDIIDERVQKVYEIQKIEETARIVCGDTVNDQGYFTRLMPLEEVPDNLIQISGAINGTYDFETFIKGVWKIGLNPYYKKFPCNGAEDDISSIWITSCAKFKRISMTKCLTITGITG
ncbi:hypothetical protein BZA77DRAFT_353576 [Pyronema omphalodes]|nr:hypothetical protein BZA77DRAFT_353576 [Pyronema omphalodes]